MKVSFIEDEGWMQLSLRALLRIQSMCQDATIFEAIHNIVINAGVNNEICRRGLTDPVPHFAPLPGRMTVMTTREGCRRQLTSEEHLLTRGDKDLHFRKFEVPLVCPFLPHRFLQSKRQANAELYLTTGRCRFCDRAELWRIHKPVGRSQVCVIQCVECLGADLQLHCFSHREFTL